MQGGRTVEATVYHHPMPSVPSPAKQPINYERRRVKEDRYHTDRARLTNKLDFGLWVDDVHEKYPRRYYDVVPDFEVELDVINEDYAKKTSQPLTVHGGLC